MAFAGRAWKEEAVRLLCAEAAAGKVPEDEAVGVHDSTSLALSTALRMVPTERPRVDLGSDQLAEFLEGKRQMAERGEEAGFLVSALPSTTGDDMERAAVVNLTKTCVLGCVAQMISGLFRAHRRRSCWTAGVRSWRRYSRRSWRRRAREARLPRPRGARASSNLSAMFCRVRFGFLHMAPASRP